MDCWPAGSDPGRRTACGVGEPAGPAHASATIPNPDPTPTPRPLECKLLEPCESTTVVLPIKNEGTLPMEGCVVRLEQVAGIEYLVGGQLLAAPFTIDVARSASRREREPPVSTSVSCAMTLRSCRVRCTSWTNTLVCGDQATLVDQICIESPCPVLPSVGK